MCTHTHLGRDTFYVLLGVNFRFWSSCSDEPWQGSCGRMCHRQSPLHRQSAWLCQKAQKKPTQQRKWLPKRGGQLAFVRGRGVKGIRLDKTNSAAPHNPSGLSHEVKGYRCPSKGFGRCGQVKGHGCNVGVYLCLCLPQVPLVLSNLLSSKVVVVMPSISRSTHFWCSTQKGRLF
jgi:hypothetical protein